MTTSFSIVISHRLCFTSMLRLVSHDTFNENIFSFQ